MFAIGADRPSEPASLRTGRRIPTIIRGVLARRKSFSSLLYLISAGLIATWIIVVFLGLGLFLLTHEPRKSVVGLGVIGQPEPTLALVKPLQPSYKEAHSGTGVGESTGEGRNVIAIDRPAVASAQPGKDQAVIELDKGAPSVDVGVSFGSLGEVVVPGPLPRGQPAAVTEPRSAPPHSASSHKPHQRQETLARATQHHAPVHAIKDVLHKHSRLLK